MITILFFVVLIGSFVALIVGTLGDEIRDFVVKINDMAHPEPVERKLRHFHDSVRR